MLIDLAVCHNERNVLCDTGQEGFFKVCYVKGTKWVATF